MTSNSDSNITRDASSDRGKLRWQEYESDIPCTKDDVENALACEVIRQRRLLLREACGPAYNSDIILRSGHLGSESD